MSRGLAASWPFTAAPPALACRGCGAPADEPVLELGPLPLPDGGLAPLRVLACSDCRLLQLDGEAPPAPASSAGMRWRDRDVEAMVAWLGLGAGCEVLEIGSRDAPTLAAFRRHGCHVLGIEPRAALARRLSAAGHAPVFISVPHALAEAGELHELLAGMRLLLAPGGVLALEVPHLLPVVQRLRFDAFRHGRLCYHTLATVEVALAPHGLAVFDVETLPGGVLRLFARHVEDRGKPVTEAVEALRARESAARLGAPLALRHFAEGVAEATHSLRSFLADARHAGRLVLGHGAPGEGETLLAHAGIGPDLLPFVAEASPLRHGGVLPGTRIPVHAPAALLAARPGIVLILSADHAPEIVRALAPIRGQGGCFALPGRRIQLFRGD